MECTTAQGGAQVTERVNAQESSQPGTRKSGADKTEDLNTSKTKTWRSLQCIFSCGEEDNRKLLVILHRVGKDMYCRWICFEFVWSVPHCVCVCVLKKKEHFGFNMLQ